MVDYRFLSHGLGISEKQIKKLLKTVNVKDKHNLTPKEAQLILETSKLGISTSFEKECQEKNIDTSSVRIFDKAILIN